MHRLIVLMGVAGCGKTSVGRALAPLIDAEYADGDDLHPESSIAKMSTGQPLTDQDRWPWLDRVGQKLGGHEGRIIVGCSSLRCAYRERIAQASGETVVYVFLSGSRETIERRMSARKGHYMPVSLLDSQFATLEPPTADEPCVVVDVDQPLDELVAQIASRLSNYVVP